MYVVRWSLNLTVKNAVYLLQSKFIVVLKKKKKYKLISMHFKIQFPTIGTIIDWHITPKNNLRPILGQFIGTTMSKYQNM